MIFPYMPTWTVWMNVIWYVEVQLFEVLLCRIKHIRERRRSYTTCLQNTETTELRAAEENQLQLIILLTTTKAEAQIY